MTLTQAEPEWKRPPQLNMLTGILRDGSNAYTLLEDRPYYTQEIIEEKTVEIIPKDQVIVIGQPVRKNGNVFAPGSFYTGEKEHKVYLYFPEDSEVSLGGYDWDTAVAVFEEEYTDLVLKNYEIKKVKPEDEKIFKQDYADYFLLKNFKDLADEETLLYYTPKKDKKALDALHGYFLGEKNIRMVLTQTDSTWKRPPLNIPGLNTATDAEEEAANE
jgi:hypothetical protein